MFQSVLFEAMVKNLAIHDELGQPKKKEVIVTVCNQKTNKVRVDSARYNRRQIRCVLILWATTEDK